MAWRWLIACLVAMILPPAQAGAGAWSRAEGTLFVTAATRLSWPQNLAHWTDRHPTSEYRTLYMEYGLTPDWTIGLDLGRAVSGGDKSVLFAQMPLRQRDRGLKATAQLGLGMIEGARTIRPGLSAGLGHERGWLSLDALAEIAAWRGERDLKLDATLGIKFARGRALILQMQLGDPEHDPAFARFAPSVVVPVSDRFKLEGGVTWGIEGDSSMGLKLGVWAEF